MPSLSFKIRLASPWTYFALALGFSWAITVPIAFSGQNVQGSPALMFAYALGGLGPALAAILLTWWTQDQAGRRDFWLRIVDFRRISPRWVGVIFLTVPLVTLLAAAVDRLLGGWGLRLEAAARFLEQPLALLPFTLFMLVFGPLPEEIGWRGYALDKLQARYSALTGSLILGVFWALWHLPLFFILGTYQHGLGFGALPSFWSFSFNIVVQSVLLAWIFNNTHRSTLAAILFHFMTNYTGELFELSPRAEIAASVLWMLLAVLVVRRWGRQTMADRRRR